MESSIIAGIVGVLLTCLNLWILYAKTKSDERIGILSKELAQVVNKQTEHDNKFVTDQRVRDIVKDEIRPLKEEVAQMNINVHKIMDSLTELTMELKVTNAIREHEKSRTV